MIVPSKFTSSANVYRRYKGPIYRPLDNFRLRALPPPRPRREPPAVATFAPLVITMIGSSSSSSSSTGRAGDLPPASNVVAAPNISAILPPVDGAAVGVGVAAGKVTVVCGEVTLGCVMEAGAVAGDHTKLADLVVAVVLMMVFVVVVVTLAAATVAMLVAGFVDGDHTIPPAGVGATVELLDLAPGSAVDCGKGGNKGVA